MTIQEFARKHDTFEKYLKKEWEMTIKKFAIKKYDTFEKRKPYKDYTVWSVSRSRLKGCNIGMPTFLLEKDGKFRFAQLPDETYEIMDTQREDILSEERNEKTEKHLGN